ncbi:MAG: Gfo/Idh/MocA family oxidoreductase [Pirellulaceae bacterium]|nr:Gfo/Idh/MocA family oxidoreductase [Pirellulaceae bacterium]
MLNNVGNRRSFLATSAIAGGAMLAGTAELGQTAHVAGSEVLKVGLIGCGPRGTGAAVNALNADPQAKLTAMADLFMENIRFSRENIRKLKGVQTAVDDDHCFTGFSGYQGVLQSDVDVVILALPPFFHPKYLQAAVDVGKHVFCEKTHAVDPPGVRAVLAAGEEAREKNLCVVSGLAWRYHAGVRETMNRVLDGAIGEINAIEATCNTGSLRCRARQSGWSEMEYQLRDWFNFTWLTCDLPGLNSVHDLDKAAWAMGDQPPLKCWGTGGRQVRVGPRFGDVWDHHATVFEYEGGTKLFAFCRQQDGCKTDISDRFYGTKGRCDLLRCRIDGEIPWRYEGPDCNRFDAEHAALFAAIRDGRAINNSLYMARSSMLAIMATWASYTGQEITWERAMKSERLAGPTTEISFETEPPTKPDARGEYPIPITGLTRFI